MLNLPNFCGKEILLNCAKFAIFWQNFDKKSEIADLCKGVHCVDLGESFQTHIYLQNFVSIQPGTSPPKFAAFAAARETLVRFWIKRDAAEPAWWDAGALQEPLPRRPGQVFGAHAFLPCDFWDGFSATSTQFSYTLPGISQISLDNCDF